MIVLERVSKTFLARGQAVVAVDDVSLEVPEGELHVLIGPSGSGKTTTMRMINRLETPSSGRILVKEKDIQAIDAVELRRSIGYVIQQGGLLPHFTVRDNVAIVPRLLGWSKSRRNGRAEELLALVGLPPDRFANRYPRELSGGQQQRVGVARALAADPAIVLMDEPFGAVDPITRKQLQRELRRIQAEVRKTIVFVTHDISEALLLGDRIVLMADGRVVQDGTPADLLRRPAGPFVTRFIGEERGIRAFQHTTLAEIAEPTPDSKVDVSPVLPGSLSILEAALRIGAGGMAEADGFTVSGDAGQPVGYLSFQRFAAILGETLGGTEDRMAEGGDELPS